MGLGEGKENVSRVLEITLSQYLSVDNILSLINICTHLQTKNLN